MALVNEKNRDVIKSAANLSQPDLVSLSRTFNFSYAPTERLVNGFFRFDQAKLFITPINVSDILKSNEAAIIMGTMDNFLLGT